MANMEMKEYFLELCNELDKFYMPDKKNSQQFDEVLREDIPKYYKHNVAPEMAVEFIAHRLKLTRKVVN